MVSWRHGTPARRHRVAARPSGGHRSARADLDHRQGDRRAWVLALAPLCRPAPGDAGSVVWRGIVMGTKAKIGAAAVLVAIGLLAWQRPWTSRPAGVEPTPIAQSSS